MEASINSPDRLQQIRGWIKVGWCIEQPILQRSAFYDRTGCVCVLEVILRLEGQRRVIALQNEPQVEAFLREHGLHVLDVA